MMSFPKKSWSKPQQSPGGKAIEPESDIQQQTDEHLDSKGYEHFHIPDGILGFVKNHELPMAFKKWFLSTFAGKCDTVFYVPIKEHLSLAVRIELKTQDKKGRTVGKTHGKQTKNVSEGRWSLCRSISEVMNVVHLSELWAANIKEMMNANR